MVGKAIYVPAAALAVAYGADGLCIEAHVEPSKGIGDDPKGAGADAGSVERDDHAGEAAVGDRRRQSVVQAK